jgi:hypothetical protein
MSESKKQSLLEKIIDGAIDAIKRPFTIKRVTRALDSGADSLEEQLLSAQAEQTAAREQFVKAAETNGESLTHHVNKLIEIQGKIAALKEAQAHLDNEKKELL